MQTVGGSNRTDVTVTAFCSDIVRRAVVRELLETEEEFVKDTQYILENYYHHLDSPSVPRDLRSQKEALFGNFKELCQFHQRLGVTTVAAKPLETLIFRDIF